MVKTKIIATLGPASSGESVLRRMVISGLDIVRLNFSHGNEQEHYQRLQLVKTINRKYRRAVKVMQDLEGYRIRVGELPAPMVLKKRRTLYLTQENIIGHDNLVHFDYEGSLKGISKGNIVYIDDGRILLRVQAIEKNRLKTYILTDGILRPRKGINIPDAHLDFDAITEKDKRDIQFAIKHKLKYVAQSFVRNAQDIKRLRNILHNCNASSEIFAKVESRQSLENLEGIIDTADGIIVARGDLGICLPIHKVPFIQKEIIKQCHRKNKPVVVATQMLDSMTENMLPTRAEVSDVANAILDGAGILLLSGETAVGRHPHRVVAMMNKIIKATEQYQCRQK